jgi:hypothetical protein
VNNMAKTRTDRFYVAQAAQSVGGLYLDPLGRFTADPLKADRFDLRADAARAATTVGGLARVIVTLDGKVL